MNFPKKKLFLPYLLAQYPSASQFNDAFDVTMKFADGIELGMPFSDPVADGPVIQQASQRVLAGFKADSVFRMLQQKRLEIPVALMTYANPVLAYGRSNFFQACAQSGVQGLIVPDVPFEESETWRMHAREHGLAWIPFVSLLTRSERTENIARAAEGFVYLLSLTGITGANIRNRDLIRQKAAEITRHTQAPVALGFGIKSPQDAEPFLQNIDAFIVGSRIIEILGKPDSTTVLVELYRQFRAILEGGLRC